MDFKKLDQIKTPEEWIDSVLEQKNKMVDKKRSGNPYGGKGSHRKDMFRIVLTMLVAVVIGGAGLTVAAATSDQFRSFLDGIFGSQKVSEVVLNHGYKKNVNQTLDTSLDSSHEEGSIQDGEDGVLNLKENTQIVGENESFISEYHTDGDDEIVDHVYVVEDNRLKELKSKEFQGDYDGSSFSFEYVIQNNEIYGYNYTGNIAFVFFKVKKQEIYVIFEEVKDDVVNKGCLASINLETNEVTKLSNDKMICNYVMSPKGKTLLCNHRADGYWSVFDIETQTEKKIPTNIINGYARASEIEYVDEYHILTSGDSFEKGDSKCYQTYLINLKTSKIEKKYNGVGEINLQWSYTWKENQVNIYSIIHGGNYTIPDVETEVQPIGNRGNYVLFGDPEEENFVYYLTNLQSQTWMKFEIPKEMQSDLEIHLMEKQKKILLTTDQKAYLVDISSL